MDPLAINRRVIWPDAAACLAAHGENREQATAAYALHMLRDPDQSIDAAVTLTGDAFGLDHAERARLRARLA